MYVAPIHTRLTGDRSRPLTHNQPPNPPPAPATRPTGFEAVRPTLVQYEKEQKSFAVNKHAKLPEAEKAIVQEAWGDYFEFYGYEK